MSRLNGKKAGDDPSVGVASNSDADARSLDRSRLALGAFEGRLCPSPSAALIFVPVCGRRDLQTLVDTHEQVADAARMLQAHTNGPHPLHDPAAAIPNAHAHRARPPPPALPTFERVRVDAIPAVAIQDDRLVVVGDAYSSAWLPFPARLPPHSNADACIKHLSGNTPRSRRSATAPSAPSSSAIGMGRYPRIHRCLPCSATRAPDQNTPAGAWWLSSA
jgi:hypothetical protein